MAKKKSAILNVRIEPALKDAIQIAAAEDDRSVASLLAALIRKHCKEKGIRIMEQADFFGEPPEREPANRA